LESTTNCSRAGAIDLRRTPIAVLDGRVVLLNGWVLPLGAVDRDERIELAMRGRTIARADLQKGSFLTTDCAHSLQSA
jgi:hypothetical protein